MSQIELGGPLPNNSANLGTLTLPRGARNPLRTMGARIVDRVRRSLSRTRKSSEEPRDKEENPQNLESSHTVPEMPTSPPPPMPANYSGEQNAQRRGVAPTPVKTKKIVLRKKAPGTNSTS